jgi:REP element-mobilizing transposase RayT
MARPPRLELAGVAHHVLQRGVNRGACFFGDADRRFYLKCLGDAAERRGCAIHAYVLMGNHVHVLATPSETGAIAAMMQDIGRRYVRVINTLYGRTGTLWEARYRSSVIDCENYFLACQRYIELNPVRAGIVPHPGAYWWSKPLLLQGRAREQAGQRASGLFEPGRQRRRAQSGLPRVVPDTARRSHARTHPRSDQHRLGVRVRRVPRPPAKRSWDDRHASPCVAVRRKVLPENCSDPFYLRL